MNRINKYLTETLKYLTEASQSQIFTAKVGRSKNHAFNNRELSFSREKDKYSFSITTIIKKGVQTEKELEINRETEVQFYNQERIIFTKGKNIIISKITYPDF